jgi:hypothetical protein
MSPLRGSLVIFPTHTRRSRAGLNSPPPLRGSTYFESRTKAPFHGKIEIKTNAQEQRGASLLPFSLLS